jgi:hypothetical protein
MLRPTMMLKIGLPSRNTVIVVRWSKALCGPQHVTHAGGFRKDWPSPVVGVEERSRRFAAAGFPSSGEVLLPFLLGGPEEVLKGEAEREGVKGVDVLACFQAASAIIQRFSQVAGEKPPPL